MTVKNLSEFLQIYRGGITIVFSGQFLNSSFNPVFVVTIGNISYHSNVRKNKYGSTYILNALIL